MSKAVIVGGSIAGLTAAKALAPYFDEIIICEADAPVSGVSPRKGVPQGRHVHGLLKGGGDALTELFPNLPDQLAARGARSADFCNEVRWYLNKRWMLRFPGNLPIYFQTRPLLEACIRENIEALPQVKFRYQSKVTDLILDEDQHRVTGVSVQKSGEEPVIISADLVIEATGRGSFLPRWLKTNNFGTVPLSETYVDLGYASCQLRLSDDPARDWTSLLIYPSGPDETKGCTLVQVENETWLLTLAGYHNDHPPSDKEGFLEFAKNLPRREVYKAVNEAEFLSEISLHKFPASIRRHYNRLPRFPLGLIPVGDSNVSLNPLFGQGMSVAVMSVRDLHHFLENCDIQADAEVENLQAKFFNRIDSIFKTPWDLAMGQDFKYKLTRGKPPFGYRIKNILKSFILRSSATDIATRFYEVVHLVEKESSFYRPFRMLKILFTQNK
jgi:2-polyprenyl-6-methoxyphenol hydroxylase-like FAD-dependent oxidoreductase